MPTPRLSSIRLAALVLVVAPLLLFGGQGRSSARPVVQPRAWPALQSDRANDVPIVRDAFVADLGPIVTLAAEDDIVVAGAGLYLIRIDATASPPVEVARSGRLPAAIEAVVLAGGHAFVSLGEAGIAVVAVLAEGPLSIVATLPTEGVARELLWRDGRLYVAAGEDGLLALDVSDVERPRMLGTLSAAEVEALGGVNALAWGVGKLIVVGDEALAKIDVGDTAAPRVSATFALDSLVEDGILVSRRDVVVMGDHAYLPAWPPLAFDIADADRIDLVGPGTRYAASECQPFVGGAYEDELLVQHEGSLVLSAESKLFVFDLEDPTRPMPRNQVGIGYGAIASVLPLAERTLVAWDDGLSVLAGPLEASGMVERGCMSLWQDRLGSGFFDSPRFDVRAEVGIIAAVDSPGFAVLDLADHAQPHVAAAAQLAVGEDLWATTLVHLMDQVAVFGVVGLNDTFSLELWDVAERASPHLGSVYAFGAFEDNPWARYVEIESVGDYLLLLGNGIPDGAEDAETWLEVLDVGDPTHVVEVARLSLTAGGRAHGMRWGRDGILWVAVANDHHDPGSASAPPILYAVDASEPVELEVLGSLPLRDEAGMSLSLDPEAVFTVDADTIYLQSEEQLVVIDAREPVAPARMPELAQPCEWWTFVIRQGLLICPSFDRLELYDLSSNPGPTRLAETGFLEDAFERVHLDDGTLYLLGYEYLRILDVRDPRGNPRLVDEQVAFGRKTMLALGETWGLVRHADRCGTLASGGATSPLPPEWPCPLAAAPVARSALAVGLDAPGRNVMSVIDFSEGHPIRRAQLRLAEPGAESFRAITASDRFAVAVASKAMVFVDVRDPMAPEVTARVRGEDFLAPGEDVYSFADRPVVMMGDVALVLVRSEWEDDGAGNRVFHTALVAVDLADPGAPRAAGRMGLGTCGNGCFTPELVRLDDVPYVVTMHREHGWIVVDARDPDELEMAARLEGPEEPLGRIAAGGPWVWATDRNEPGIVRQYLLADPLRPREVSRRLLPGRARDLAASGDQVFVMDAQAGPLRLRIGAGLRASDILLPYLGR